MSAAGAGAGNPVAVIGAAHGPGDCSSLAVDPSQRLLITGGHDKMLKAWALAGMRDASLPAPAPAAGAGAGAGVGEEETPVQSFVGHAAAVLEVAFCSGGRRVVSVGEGNAVFVWGVDAHAVQQLDEAATQPAEPEPTSITFEEADDYNTDDDDDDVNAGGHRPDVHSPMRARSPARSSLKSPSKYSPGPAAAAAGAGRRSTDMGAPAAKKQLVVKSPMKSRPSAAHRTAAAAPVGPARCCPPRHPPAFRTLVY